MLVVTLLHASAPNGILYVGVTSDLVRRVYEHRNGLIPGFTKRYGIKRLVYFERYEDIQTAIQREHNIKQVTDVEGAVDPRQQSGME